MQVCKKIIVKGVVQGVFFRAAAQAQAGLLGVRGEVFNLKNGWVQINAEGEMDAVQALIRWCHHGPPRAKVEEVLVEDVVFSGYQNFKVIKP